MSLIDLDQQVMKFAVVVYFVSHGLHFVLVKDPFVLKLVIFLYSFYSMPPTIITG